MESTINERINLIMSEFGFKSKRAFADKIGIAQTSFNDILRGAEPKYSTLYKIMLAEPLISSEWLLVGSGPMLKEDLKKNQTPEADMLLSEVKSLKKELKESYIEIGRLQGENRILREQANLGERKVNGKSA